MSLDTKSFNLTRIMPVTVDRLWHLLTDAKARGNWSGPDATTLLETETADLRVGGQDRHRFGPADAPEFVVDTRWYDLTAPDRAVFTETLIFGGAAVCTSLVTYVLQSNGKHTELQTTVAVSSFSGSDTLDEVHTGWNGGMDNLERHAATIA